MSEPIQPLVCRGDVLRFCRLLAARFQVSNQILKVAWLKIVSEGRHDLAADDDLLPQLCLRFPSSHSRKIGPFVPANAPNAVAVLAPALAEDCGAVSSLAAGSGNGEGRKRENKRSNEQQRSH